MAPSSVASPKVAAPATVSGEYAAPDWVLQSSTADIPAAWDATAVYDAATSQVVLFGGSYLYNGVYYQSNETWVWNGSTWANATTTGSPPARAGAYMSYDASAKEVVLFGGRDAAWNALSDTWTWNGTSWTQQNPAQAPSARAYGGMAYDGAIGQSVLYGGAATSTTRTFDSDVWEYKSSTDTWTNLGTLVPGPGERVDDQLGYDPATGQLLMFGGSTCPTCVALADTWTFNGSSWTQQKPAVSPPGRYLYRVAFDPNAGGSSGGVVMFGGMNNTGASMNDTWVWTGSTWLQADGVASPPGTSLQAMAFDTKASQMVVLGGQGSALWPQTWTYTWSVPTLTQFLLNAPSPPVYIQGSPVTVAVAAGNVSSTSMSNVTVTETLPAGMTAAGSIPTVYPGGATLCTGAVTCDVSASKVVVSGLNIAGNNGIVLFQFQAVADQASAQCQAETLTALAENSTGTAYGSSAPVTAQAEVCDTGLGSQAWWSYASHNAGSQGTAAVNVANGNLVFDENDSTAVQATGTLGLQPRRVYNSQDLAAPVAGAGGELGAGWQLSVVNTGGDSAGATALAVPPADEVTLAPLAVTLVDDTGTRQVFTLKASAAPGSPSPLTAVAVSYPGGTVSGELASLLAPMSIGLPTSGSSPYVGGLLCVDATYKAPPGLNATLYRYVALGAGATACDEATHNGAAAVTAGFALVDASGLRQEFSPDGQLLAVVDRAGNQIRLVYQSTTAGQPVTPGMNLNLGNLTKAYDPAACPATGCRAVTFSYGTGKVTMVDTAGRTTTYTTVTVNNVAYLVAVTNPDGSIEQYSYQGVSYSGYTQPNPPTACGAATGQLCAVSDGNTNWTTFAYTSGAALPGAAAPNRVQAMVDAQANVSMQNPLPTGAVPAAVSPGSVTVVGYNDAADYVTVDEGPWSVTGQTAPYAGCSAGSGSSACHRSLYGSIDAAGRVQEIDTGDASGQTGGATGSYLSQEGFLWDGDSYLVGNPANPALQSS
ncbi:MAG: kelch repeat-containing protein, partial [Acidimicrobiales bacterium]